jgi:alpha-glucan,water dikinase
LQVVGAKACNLAKLRQKLPDWILVPRSIALPFGTFEAVLTDPTNAGVAAELQQIQRKLSGFAKQGGAGSSSGTNGGGAAAAAAAAVAAGSSGGETPVALLARARALVNTELKPPQLMQQVRL